MGEETRYLGRWELAGVGGVVVAIDVIRAFTTAAYAFAGGARRIWLTEDVDDAVALGRSIEGALVMGEDGGLQPGGFDLSNSPVGVSLADVSGRELVQRTSAGTRGLLAAADADRVFAASLVCASATARAIGAAVESGGYGPPSYVITGRFDDRPDRPGADDLATARFIEAVRTGGPPPAGAAAAVAAEVEGSDEAARTLALGAPHVHPDDIRVAVDVDRFAFAMEATRVDGRVVLERRDP